MAQPAVALGPDPLDQPRHFQPAEHGCQVLPADHREGGQLLHGHPLQGAFPADMSMCQFAPGGVLQPHGHPLGETFCVLDGKVVFVAGGADCLLRPGDVAFAGLGCIHSFENRSARPCRFLETRSPSPPVLHEARFNRDWGHVG